MTKRKVKKETRCCDSLLEIAGRRFLGVPTERCFLRSDQHVKVIEGPIEVQNSDGSIFPILKVEHINEVGGLHSGWVQADHLEPAE